MPQYKYSRDDYYRLTNAPCLDVAKALGMEINERESDRKSWKIKGEQGLCIYREGNGWYRFSDGRHGFPIDLVKDKAMLFHRAGARFHRSLCCERSFRAGEYSLPDCPVRAGETA